MAQSIDDAFLQAVPEYSEKFKGFVKIVLRVTGSTSLAYQVPQAVEDAQLYLLSPEDFGQVVLSSLVKENCDILPLSTSVLLEVGDITDMSQVPKSVLTPLLPVLSGTFVDPSVPLTPDVWSLVLEGRFMKCCPRIQCGGCKLNRLVTPRVLAKYKEEHSFTCKEMGLSCFSFAQLKPCDVLEASTAEKNELKSDVSSKEEKQSLKHEDVPSISQYPNSDQWVLESHASSTSPSKASGTILSASDAFNRGPRPDKLKYTAPTLFERQEYEVIVKENPNVFGVRALAKLATSNQAPTYAAEKSISAWTTWKSAWEGLFAKHGVSNPIVQAQVAMLSLKGEAQDWWNSRWQSHPEPHITWDGLVTLLKATFYPLDAQDNAFTAWNALEYRGNISMFFSDVRKTFRIYPISMEHLLSILSFRLGKGFARKVKTRLASGSREELSIYELEAIADELLSFDQVARMAASRAASHSISIGKNNDSSTRSLTLNTSTPTSQKSLLSPSPSASKDRVMKQVKPNSEKKKVAAVDGPPIPRVRQCFICDDTSHFCYHCPLRKPQGCPLCGEEHRWQDCPALEGKFFKRKDVSAIDIQLSNDVEECLSLHEESDNEAAEIAVSNICWQTHEPLCLASIEWKEKPPIRLSCLHTPAFSRRLLYRCQVQDQVARCLFDNGANCSLMSLSWAEKNNIPCKPVDSSVKTAVQDVTTLKFITWPLKFELGDFCTRWQFYIVPSLSHDIFLGTDFALRFRVTYDPFDWSMIILGDITDSKQLPTFLKSPLHDGKPKECEAVAIEDNEPEEGDDGTVDSKLIQEIDSLCKRLPILIQYRPLFFPVLGNVPDRQIDHNIKLKPGVQPVKHNPYPLSSEKYEAMVSTISELLEANAIEPSFSPWSSPLLFVKKKDGGWRMCVDFRSVNAVTKHDAYPLPRINILLQKLGRAKYFSKIDLASGFHQVPVREEAREITAFCTPQPVKGHSHFQWKVMPFGLVNAPATFQRLMDSVLGGLMNRCVVYLDDILIYSETLAEHLNSLQVVLDRLIKHRLYIKASKCSFVQQEITFLGYVVGAGEIRLESEKSNKICNWKPPLTSAKDVRKFWGLVSWCRMFFPHLASIAAPLTSLVGTRRKFIWTAEAEHAMRAIQEICLKAPVLIPWNEDCETRVTTDASDVGLGAVLEQKVNGIWRPVEFWSRKLKSAETRYSATDKEWLAIVEAVSSHWRHLLERKKITVRTDHRPLLKKLTSASSNPPLLHRHARWVERLSPFSLCLEHVPGSDNKIADALSRAPEFYHVDSMLVELQDAVTLKDAIAEDVVYQQRAREIQESCKSVSSPWKDFVVKNGIIYRPEGVIEVPAVPRFKTALLEANHDHPLAGHFGRDRTLDLLRRKWFWKGMAKDVEAYVQSCDRCNKVKSAGKQNLPPLQPILSNRPWAIITLDFVGSFEPAAGTRNTECLVMVDKFTKMVHLAGCRKEIDAKETAFLVIRHVLALHGIPEKILSDRGPQFDSRVWMDIWSILGARVKLAAPQHPQTDGQSERSIRTFVQLLRAYTETQRDQWEIFLPVFEFAMNNAVNSSTSITPFFANFGRHPRTTDVLLGGDEALYIEDTSVGRDLRRRLQRIWRVIDEKLRKTADQMIARSVSSRQATQFDMGDKVYLSKKRGRSQLSKQEALFSGPYPIKKKLGKATYVLGGTPAAIPALQNIQHLRPFSSSPPQFEGRTQRVADVPADSTGDEREVEKILKHRGDGAHRRYLIKWKDSDENTWLPPKNLLNCQEILQEYLLENGLANSPDSQTGEDKPGILDGKSKLGSPMSDVDGSSTF